MRRFKKPLPMVFLACLLAAVIGGALYPPANYDGICYRIPRILHWWSEGRWHWIGGLNARMDYSATGFEWMMLPLLALFRTDRLFFLVNVISYALLPGLLYSVWVSLGISRRVAWSWMWLLPTAYCFALQAGSIGNDSFAAVFFLTAIAFALRAGCRGSMWDASIALLAAGLLTGAKATNLPLLLPIAVAFLPGLRALLGRMLPLIALGLVAAAVSFLPLAATNTLRTGDWSGDPDNSGKMKLERPLPAIAGNTLQLAAGCLAPPVLPVARAWNDLAARALDREPMRSIRAHYPRLSLALSELPSEEGAGLGLGITCLLLLSIVGALFFGGGIRSYLALLIGICCWLSLLVYMAKMGSECTARLVASYYPGLIIPLLALHSQERLVRRNWWRGGALIAALSVFPPLIMSPVRPLVPMLAMVEFAGKIGLPKGLVDRARTVYLVYGERSDNLAPVRAQLPLNARTIGFAGTADESELSFWKPYGERRVVDLAQGDGLSANLQRFDCVVGSEWGINDRFGIDGIALAHRLGGTLAWHGKVCTRAGTPPLEWTIILPEKMGRHSKP